MSVWDVFWFIFIFVPLLILWVIVLVEVFNRRDLVGWQKALWVMGVIFFPWIGVFAYLILRPRDLPLGAAARSPGQGTPQSAPQAARTAETATYAGDSRATS